MGRGIIAKFLWEIQSQFKWTTPHPMQMPRMRECALGFISLYGSEICVLRPAIPSNGPKPASFFRWSAQGNSMVVHRLAGGRGKVPHGHVEKENTMSVSCRKIRLGLVLALLGAACAHAMDGDLLSDANRFILGVDQLAAKRVEIAAD